VAHGGVEFVAPWHRAPTTQGMRGDGFIGWGPNHHFDARALAGGARRLNSAAPGCCEPVANSARLGRLSSIFFKSLIPLRVLKKKQSPEIRHESCSFNALIRQEQEKSGDSARSSPRDAKPP
jgi:hypothetical protein